MPVLVRVVDLEMHNPEIDDLYGTVVLYQDIPGLDVAMDNAILMRVIEPQADLLRQFQLGCQGDLRPPRNDALQAFAFHELHGDVRVTLKFPEIKNRHDIGMLESSGRLRLSIKAL